MVSVSTAAFYGRSNQQLSSLRTRAEALQQQIGSGERLSRSSDDPAAAARLRALDRNQRLSAINQTNSDRATTDLTLADEGLVGMADIVIRAKELALQAGNSALSVTGQKAIATELTNLQAGLLSLANARDAAGNALFGGEAAGDAYTLIAGVISYQGVGAAPLTDLGDGQSVVRSLTGPDILSFTGASGATDMFKVLGDLAAALTTGGAAALAGATDAIGSLDAGLEKITTAQTVIGTRQAWVETIDNRRTASDELQSEERANLGGADQASTIVRLKELTTILEASQASFVRLSGLTLFNQIN